ncbi:sensor histidine kinase [Saccharopolyspora aridisoli]|uniref:Sensor-like histidine kinase SenX3 n=1 Tax=Saccharopolyspora aridisoli TaxID=2530385 RepID=A0A4V2Y813_9PSEU|nr:sensor histidine kinase [Saccharopolyspora aridisoli]
MGYTALIIAALLLGAVGGFLAAGGPRPYRKSQPQGPTVAELLQRQVHTSTSGVVLLNRFGDVVLHNPRAVELGVIHDYRADPRAQKAAEQARKTGETVTVDLCPLDGRASLAGRGPAAVIGDVRPLGDGFTVVDAADQSDSVRLEATRRDFVANVSHELKTPVGALALLAEALLDTAEDPEEVRRFSTKILHESTRLGTLVSELIALSRLQGAERLPELHSVEVDEVVEEALGRSRLAAESAGIEIAVDGPSGYLLEGDRALLVTALTNLITNAVNYSSHGSPVSISRRLSEDFVEIAVTDRGIGIEPEHHERVFERFFRVDPARSRATGGTGLGLAIVKHVAANHGGEVKLWSRPGTGSTFTIRVPRHGTGGVDGAGEVGGDVATTEPDRAAPAARSITESADGVTTVETGGVR